MRSTLEQAGGSINQRGETCRLRRHRPRPRNGKATIGRQEVGIPGILHGLTVLEFFSDRTIFVWQGDKLPDNRRGVQTEHPLARHICAHAAHHRTHRTDVPPTQDAWLKIAHCSVSQTTCHPSVTSHMMPQLPQNTSTRSLSHQHHLPSDHFLPHCAVLPRPILDWIKKPCETHGGVADTVNLHLSHSLCSFTRFNGRELS